MELTWGVQIIKQENKASLRIMTLEVVLCFIAKNDFSDLDTLQVADCGSVPNFSLGLSNLTQPCHLVLVSATALMHSGIWF